jgi:hypothetical protein
VCSSPRSAMMNMAWNLSICHSGRNKQRT